MFRKLFSLIGSLFGKKTFREETVLFMYGAIHWMNSHGLSDGGTYINLTDKGISQFDQLEASGFRPTEAEAHECVTGARLLGHIKCCDRDAAMLVGALSTWDKIKAVQEEMTKYNDAVDTSEI